MIIKSHVRGGYRAAADYLKSVGKNERIRLVEISDSEAKDLDQAFRNMWMIGRTTRASKPLHHVSINPFKDERLTDGQVRKICERLEEKFGYKPGEHQRVIVEHIKDGRQHFHVIWNRVGLRTGRPVWPGQHWNKSKQVAREMEIELGLKRPTPRRSPRHQRNPCIRKHRQQGRKKHGRNRVRTITGDYLRVCKHPLRDLRLWLDEARPIRRQGRGHFHLVPAQSRAGMAADDFLRPTRTARTRSVETEPYRPTPCELRQPPRRMSVDELIAWAWENRKRPTEHRLAPQPLRE
jgi:hypothetical protein